MASLGNIEMTIQTEWGPRPRGLFEVWIIDPESGEEVAYQSVVAASEENARMRVVREYYLARDLDDYDIICRRVGTVRPKSA
ncbi:MAG TPA: hypothetical protein VK066_20090 [Chloroflexota bacterium]|nr:hypothetical protein [Chloroflexota bacterium]